ncbi:MAG: MtnX-like HAD-IB family phosphatase [Candidatus Omnitrophota bacterium]
MELTRPVVFFDFDNTITKIDVLDDMLERFSGDDGWMRLEDEWKRGRIGSRECLDGQMRGIRIGRRRLDGYLATIEIDPYFRKLLDLCDSKKIKAVILSDNFGHILNGILRKNGISGPDVYCNSLKISENRLIPDFPYTDKKCGGCAHCKTKNMLANTKDGFTSVYIGDGLSDLCPARKAGLVFAKSALRRKLEEEKVPHIPFVDMREIYEYFKRRIS